jgi:hypothetical protein
VETFRRSGHRNVQHELPAPQTQLKDDFMTDRNDALSTYRFFAVDDHDVVLWDRSIDCLNDEDACDAAGNLSYAGITIEVWDVARLVGSCPASHLV